MTDEPSKSSDQTPDEPPPLLGTWRNLYWLLVIQLVLIALLSYGLAQWAS